MPRIIKDGEVIYVTPEEYNQMLRENEPMKFDEHGVLESVKDTQLGTVRINGQTFTGLANEGLISYNRKVWTEEPTRAGDYSMPNIRDHTTGFIPAVDLIFSFLTMKDFLRLVKATEPNEFPIEYFSKEHGRRISILVYMLPNEQSKMHSYIDNVYGVVDYKIGFVATMNDRVSGGSPVLKYNINGGGSALGFNDFSMVATWMVGDVVKSSKSYYKCLIQCVGIDVNNSTYWRKMNADVIEGRTGYWGMQYNVATLQDILDYYQITNGKSLSSFNTKANGTGYTYYPGQGATLTESTTLYCIWN